MGKIMIYGTTSSAGKSLTCTALCRIFSNKGYRVAPFKSQNMSSIYTLTKNNKVISSAQALQARAARVEPNEYMNPLLLKPKSNVGSEVFYLGESIGDMSAKEYFSYKRDIAPKIKGIFDTLYADSDIVVIEGAGSPAEINLSENDIVNTGMAKLADSKALLVADIDKGGVFAAIYGTIMLLPDEDRSRIVGIIINKFRGDVDLLKPGLKMIEELTGVPVVGVVPYGNYHLEDEDSLVDPGKENVKLITDEEIDMEIEKLAKDFEASLDMEYIMKEMGI